MEKNNPVRHHYIPRFLIRNFADEDGMVYYVDKASKANIKKHPEDIFVINNMYRDEINSPDEPVRMEKDLAKFESEVAGIIRKMLVGDEIRIYRREEEALRLFLAIMSFRSERTRSYFSKGVSGFGEKYFEKFQEDGDFTDFWKRNLGELVKCRSLRDVFKSEKIDEPIKVFMHRDMYGILGSYFTVFEKRGKEDFVLSDAFPDVFEGSWDNGLKWPLYNICPISKKRVLVQFANGVEAAPDSVVQFDKKVIRRPQLSRDGNLLMFKVQRIYQKDVEWINEAAIENSHVGYIS